MNQAINFFWTTLCFGPVIICWCFADSLAPCYWFLAVGFLCLFIPMRWLQLSDKPAFYTGLGIKLFRKFVQNGDYVNRAIRKSNPAHRVIKGRQGPASYMKTLAMYHAYHFGCLVFFTLTAIHAFIQGQYLFAMLIIPANTLYNIYPIFLQQYNRARVAKVTGRQTI
ncbi:hypothetical protein HQ865_05700 [Mucilaginibacter mali]|uniref:Glycosyl-4,4'-diaponeurosporenoate acyltransferase n=1 Tax=Mucilaginibacter mali TaxID=2740462 RepID=A0A7D4PSR0_9SPHI|nr:hypothetical protein [Mucilaginibacter mali]QKJ29268.1 hypothetical protein HQ865_05700 [Mucilaginibacter mali]